jgi:uncharacterized protein
MKWSIHQLRKNASKGIAIDEMVDVSELKRLNAEIREVFPAHITGRMDYNESKITFHLNIKGKLILPCSRTLVDVEFPYDIDTMETFVQPNDYSKEQDELVLESDVVDLMPLILENILLEIPMQVIAENVDESKAIAPQKGRHWDVYREGELIPTEEKSQDDINPKMADLAKFFNKDKE